MRSETQPGAAFGSAFGNGADDPKTLQASAGRTAHTDFAREGRVKRTAEEIEIKLICAGQLLQKEAPKREWFCYPWFPRWEVTLLSGDGGIGKSTLTTQAAISSALGIQWLSHDILKGRTLILTAEDGRDELQANSRSGITVRPQRRP